MPHPKIEVCEVVYENTKTLTLELEKFFEELEERSGVLSSILSLKVTAIRYGLESMKECND